MKELWPDPTLISFKQLSLSASSDLLLRLHGQRQHNTLMEDLRSIYGIAADGLVKHLESIGLIIVQHNSVSLSVSGFRHLVNKTCKFENGDIIELINDKRTQFEVVNTPMPGAFVSMFDGTIGEHYYELKVIDNVVHKGHIIVGLQNIIEKDFMKAKRS